jgi:diguanylate cyclase
VLGNLRTLALAERQAATDGLTGLANNRSFRDVLKRSTALADRAGVPLSALMLDIDHFKKVNDNFGHDRGDQALAAIAAAIAGGIRASDFAARYGGEEFVVLLPDTNLDGALAVAETLRTAIASMPLAAIGLLTVSVGVATMPDHAADGDTLIRAADGALYLAKERGRNRVEVALRFESPGSGAAEAEAEAEADLALT